MPPATRERLVREFIRLALPLVGASPGKKLRAESEMARLISTFDRELLQIAATTAEDPEFQMAAWLRNLASLPAGSTISRETARIRISLGLLPRPRGSFVLEHPVFPIPENPQTKDT